MILSERGIYGRKRRRLECLTHAKEVGTDLLTRPNENTSAAPPHPNHVTSSAQTPPTRERTNQNVRLHVILLHFLNINRVTAESAQPRYRQACEGLGTKFVFGDKIKATPTLPPLSQFPLVWFYHTTAYH